MNFMKYLVNVLAILSIASILTFVITGVKLYTPAEDLFDGLLIFMTHLVPLIIAGIIQTVDS